MQKLLQMMTLICRLVRVKNTDVGGSDPHITAVEDGQHGHAYSQFDKLQVDWNVNCIVPVYKRHS